MVKVLNKSEFMSLVINDYYKKRFNKRQEQGAAKSFTIDRMSSERDKRLKKRGF